MKLVVQRVNKAKVEVSGKLVGEIDNGVFVLIGIEKGDTEVKADCLAEKLLNLRVMQDKNGKMNKSVADSGANILAVSQFTLISNTLKGNRPSFIDAEEPEKARKLYDYFVSFLKESDLNIQTGEFGKYMKISLELDGPVTITLEK